MCLVEGVLGGHSLIVASRGFQVKPILAAITIILKATNIYKDGQLEADAGCEYEAL